MGGVEHLAEHFSGLQPNHGIKRNQRVIFGLGYTRHRFCVGTGVGPAGFHPGT